VAQILAYGGQVVYRQTTDALVFLSNLFPRIAGASTRSSSCPTDDLVVPLLDSICYSIAALTALSSLLTP
jgi:hypothetical protein